MQICIIHSSAVRSGLKNMQSGVAYSEKFLESRLTVSPKAKQKDHVSMNLQSGIDRAK